MSGEEVRGEGGRQGGKHGAGVEGAARAAREQACQHGRELSWIGLVEGEPSFATSSTHESPLCSRRQREHGRCLPQLTRAARQAVQIDLRSLRF